MLNHPAIMLNKLSVNAGIYPVQLSISIDLNFPAHLPPGLGSKSYEDDYGE